MIEKLYTVEEVAELASVTGRTIRNYLKSGRLVGRAGVGRQQAPSVWLGRPRMHHCLEGSGENRSNQRHAYRRLPSQSTQVGECG